MDASGRFVSSTCVVDSPTFRELGSSPPEMSLGLEPVSPPCFGFLPTSAPPPPAQPQLAPFAVAGDNTDSLDDSDDSSPPRDFTCIKRDVVPEPQPKKRRKPAGTG